MVTITERGTVLLEIVWMGRWEPNTHLLDCKGFFRLDLTGFEEGILL